MLKPVNLQSLDTIVNYVISLFNNVPVDDVLKVIRNKLHYGDIHMHGELLEIGS